jgi:hypothetical protein
VSIPWDILQAVKALAEGVVAPPAVKVRKTPFHSSEWGDPLPMICLAMGKESVHNEDMKGGVRMLWPVMVAYFQAKNSTLEDPAQLQLQYATREALRLALWRQRLDDAPTVIGCRYDPDPAFDLAGLDAHFDISRQLFTYQSSESRGS